MKLTSRKLVLPPTISSDIAPAKTGPTHKMLDILKEIVSIAVIISYLRQPKASEEQRRGEVQDNTFQDRFEFFLSETLSQIILRGDFMKLP